jgi:hypothetical protein
MSFEAILFTCALAACVMVVSFGIQAFIFYKSKPEPVKKDEPRPPHRNKAT